MDTPDLDALDRADMERLVAGQDTALNELMARHAPGLFRFLHRMLGNEDDANDLAQETFVRVYRARTSYKRTQRFSAWLFTIAANLARNHLRWRARHPDIPLDAALATEPQRGGEALAAQTGIPDRDAEASDCAAAVRRAVQQLPPDLREAIVLCEWEELSTNEAAAILHTTPKAVESRLYRARQLLRERLKPWL